MDLLLSILTSVWSFIASWLSGQNLYMPTAAFIAMIPVIVDRIKKALSVAETPILVSLTHGWGPRILNALLSLVLVVAASVGQDDPLTALEGLQAIAAFMVALGLNFAGAEGVYKLLKTILGDKF